MNTHLNARARATFVWCVARRGVSQRGRLARVTKSAFPALANVASIVYETFMILVVCFFVRDFIHDCMVIHARTLSSTYSYSNVMMDGYSYASSSS